MAPASPSFCPATPEGPCQVATPCPAGEGVPSSLERGQDFYRRKQFSEPVGREVGGLLPSPLLINVLPIWESKLCAPHPPPHYTGHGLLGEQRAWGRPPKLASSKLLLTASAPRPPPRPPASRGRVETQSPQTACREKGPVPVPPFSPP